MHRILSCLVLGAVVAVSLVRGSSPSPAADTPAAPDVLTPRWEGVGSCASTACHGSTAGRIKEGEYSIWMDRDPHHNAYRVLFDERSQRIVRNLYGTDAAPAQKTQVCLNCHATTPPADRDGSHYTAEDGVGCESCHGAAGNWLAQHSQPSWKLLSADDKARFGMRDTKDLALRGKVCAECHIGSPGRDVNHDLIAAGHPRMDFELALFTAKMPKHWYEWDEKARHPDFEARIWLVGQATSAEAALELLAYRAENSTTRKTPWPEFAEYACYACHHDLREPSPRQKVGYGDRLPGGLPWGTWYYSMTRTLQDAGGPAVDKEGSPLTKLRALMNNPGLDPAMAARLARETASEFATALRSIQGQRIDASRADQLLRGVVQLGAGTEPATWDQAAQEYLAVAAFYHGLTDLDPARRSPALRQSIEGLLPLVEPKSAFTSPQLLDPGSFRNQMKNVNNLLIGH